MNQIDKLAISQGHILHVEAKVDGILFLMEVNRCMGHIFIVFSLNCKCI